MTVAFAGLVSLALGAHAALNKHVMDSARAAVGLESAQAAKASI